MKKRITSAALALAAATALAGTNISAVRNYTFTDLKSLNDALLNAAPVSEGQDINEDGVVNAFDMVMLRGILSQSGEVRDLTVKPTEDNVKYIGRNVCKDGVVSLVHSGSAIEFTVTGRSAEVTIKGDGSEKNGENYRPRYAVIVDGEVILDEVQSEAAKTVKLFSSQTEKTATVKIIHLSEANNGAVCVGDIKVSSGAASPIAPTPRKKLNIEFIGDSITCAYGVEGKDQYEGFKTSTENFMKSYAYLTAQKLDADYSAVSYSGHGIISGYSSDGKRETGSLVPDYYGNVGKLDPYAVPWDFSKSQPDVIVINLGTNDDTYVSKEYETRSVEFKDEYVKFLETVHKNNPESYIICTVGTMGCEEMYPCIEAAVKEFKASSGYERVMSYQSATQNMADGLGSDWHPSLVTQQNSAYVLADKICQALGMESDQVGLNVAADAKYATTAADGAMMSDYFSDWDKSYHITTVTGGTSPESIQVHISGIGLKKGGKYTLTFQFDTAEGVKLPLSLRDADGGTVFHKDTITGTGSKAAYSADFTASATGEADLVLNMGGVDSLRLSLYDLKLTKTA